MRVPHRRTQGTVLFAMPMSRDHRIVMRKHQWPFFLVMACNLVSVTVLCAPLLSAAAAGHATPLAGRSLATGGGSAGDAGGGGGSGEYVPPAASTAGHLAAALLVGALGVVATWRLHATLLQL